MDVWQDGFWQPMKLVGGRLSDPLVESLANESDSVWF